jgi:hypothetical protein
VTAFVEAKSDRDVVSRTWKLSPQVLPGGPGSAHPGQ